MKAKTLSILLAACIPFLLVFSISQDPAAASGREDYIEVIVKESDGCNASGGEFDAIYYGRDIDVRFFFASGGNNKALEIKDKGKDLQDVKSIVCPPPGKKKIPISGKKLKLEGLWRSPETFIAYEIYLSE